MRKILGSVLALSVFVGIFGATIAGDTQLPKPIEVTDTVTVKATVEAVDKTNRMLTLKGPKGNVVTLAVDEAVQRFDQIKVGDTVTAKYYESVVLQVQRPGAAPADSATIEATKLEGVKPAGAAMAQTVTTVTIEAIDLDTPAVTVRTADGASVSFRVQKKSRLKNVQVGDQVVITQTAGLAVGVEASK